MGLGTTGPIHAVLEFTVAISDSAVLIYCGILHKNGKFQTPHARLVVTAYPNIFHIKILLVSVRFLCLDVTF